MSLPQNRHATATIILAWFMLPSSVAQWVVPPDVTVGDTCVFTNTDYDKIVFDASVEIQYSNMAKWRSNPFYADVPVEYCDLPSTDKCRLDANGKYYAKITNNYLDMAEQNSAYPTKSFVGADVYDDPNGADPIPSGIRLSNALTTPTGVKYDMHIDIDYHCC